MDELTRNGGGGGGGGGFNLVREGFDFFKV